MQQADDLDFELVRAAEVALLSPEVRGDPAAVGALLAVDFAEIGRSGRLWNRDSIIESLRIESLRIGSLRRESLDDERPATPETSQWAFARVADDLVLVTYLVHGSPCHSRHSSLWSLPGPVLKFHQGTYVDG